MRAVPLLAALAVAAAFVPPVCAEGDQDCLDKAVFYGTMAELHARYEAKTAYATTSVAFTELYVAGADCVAQPDAGSAGIEDADTDGDDKTTPVVGPALVLMAICGAAIALRRRGA